MSIVISAILPKFKLLTHCPHVPLFLQVIFCVILSLAVTQSGCGFSTTGSDDYLLSYIDTTDDSYSYLNKDGDVIIPRGKYMICFTDTFRTYAIVLQQDKGFIGIDRNEKELYRVFPFDNGPDISSDGLFRIIRDDKIGYADSLTGKIVIQPRYPCAFPFQEGKAKVSLNCDSRQEGEHSSWTGEEWFFIDKSGKKTSAPVDEFSEKLVVPDSIILRADAQLISVIRKIDATTEWKQVLSEELTGSTEGGEAKYYYNDKLEKIESRQFGETYQQWDAYYFKDDTLSFVFERHFQYNRPVYYDRKASKQAGDSVVFDPAKSIITDQANFFRGGKLVRTTFNGPDAVRGKKNLAAELQRIQLNLRALLQYRNKLQ